MAVFDRPLKVGKIDNFTLTLAGGYLDGETIVSATVTTTDTDLSLDSFVFNADTISAVCTGIAEGEAELHYSWTTASRSGCESHTVIILDC